jgi:hypothetical protein
MEDDPKNAKQEYFSNHWLDPNLKLMLRGPSQMFWKLNMMMTPYGRRPPN